RLGAANRLFGCGIDTHYIRAMNRHSHFNNATLRLSFARFEVTLTHIHTLYHYPVLFYKYSKNRTLLAFVWPANYCNFVTLFNRHNHYTTSGAKEIILLKPFSRNSRGTGPKTRVPRGSLSAL